MKTKIDIISGFLGAGKTTFIKKLLMGNKNKEKIIIIENEFGKAGIDGTLLKSYNVEVKEINSGCICCSLAGEFEKAINAVIVDFIPDRIIIEPSGVGKLSQVMEACKTDKLKKIAEINRLITIVDITKYDRFVISFGDFYKDQIKNANLLILSRIDDINDSYIETIKKDIKKYNTKANIISTSWDNIDTEKIMENIDQSQINKTRKLRVSNNRPIINKSIMKDIEHKNSGNSFSVLSVYTSKIFLIKHLESILNTLDNESEYGVILRGKGILQIEDNKWIQFDYTPGEIVIKAAKPESIGQLSIIGDKIDNDKIKNLFE